jgi:endonuclease/exonuclease/phosphatase family metal-dependent hydrolase
VVALGLSGGALGCSLAENYTDPAAPRYSGQFALDPGDPAELPHLRVVTFNVKFGVEYERAGEELAEDPRLAGADIVLLQEMDAPGTDAIAERLGMDYVYYPGSVHKTGRDFGNAVLSRWPLRSDAKLILPHRNPTDGRLRIAVMAVVDTPLGPVRAYSVHTETPWLGPRARLEQAAAVLEDARDALEPVIAAGDFNTSDPGALGRTVGLYESRGFLWASRGVGATAGGFALDHTFVRGCEPLDSGSAPTRASDHRPQWARVDLAR